MIAVIPKKISVALSFLSIQRKAHKLRCTPKIDLLTRFPSSHLVFPLGRRVKSLLSVSKPEIVGEN